MNITYDIVEETIRKLASDFAEKELLPIAAEIDEKSIYPEESFQKMTKVGFTGIGIPKKYGGSDGNDIHKCIVVEELSKICAATGGILSIHGVFAQGILLFGTEEQKIKYLPKVASGGYHAAFALTEPNAGSDAANVKTTAVLDKDEYILNGTKCFITGGAHADFVLVIASTNREKGVKGLSAFIVEKGTPGFSIGKTEDKMGIRASETSELIFENCKIPKKNLVGREGSGFKIAMILLDGARIGVAAQALGIAEGAIQESVKYMHQRVQFKKPIANLQGLQWYISEMATKTEAARWLIYRACSLKINGEKYTKEAAMAKLNASEVARFVTNLALQIHGGYGYMKDYPLERMSRDAKITEIYEGTSEIHKLVIARSILF